MIILDVPLKNLGPKNDSPDTYRGFSKTLPDITSESVETVWVLALYISLCPC